jgi:hypothetical protein
MPALIREFVECHNLECTNNTTMRPLAWNTRPTPDEVDREENHCKDCCCARSWQALGINQYTGKSIPEHIEELKLSAMPQQVVSEWQPIETAPEHCRVLLYCPYRCVSNPERIEADYYSFNGSYHSWATHWMPLPQPPAASIVNSRQPSILHLKEVQGLLDALETIKTQHLSAMVMQGIAANALAAFQQLRDSVKEE